MNCPICSKELPKGRRKFCSVKCQNKNYYNKNKEKLIEYNIEYQEKNPEKVKVWHKKAMDTYLNKDREHFNKLMRNQHFKHKDRWDARNRTNKMQTNKKNPLIIDKHCKICSSPNNLRLKFEIYPDVREIREAVKQGKIYYVCRECR